MGMIINPYVASYDADAVTFFSAAAITSDAQRNAVNALVVTMKADGTWSKMVALWPMVGGSSSSHAVNLKTPGTYNLTFNGGITHDSNGVTWNGTTGYAGTGITPNSHLPDRSIHLSYYTRTNDTSGTTTTCEMGTGYQLSGSDYPYLELYVAYSGAAVFTAGNVFVGSCTAAVGTSAGYTLGVQRTSTEQKLFRDGALLATRTVLEAAVAITRELRLGAGVNVAGSVVSHTNRQCAFASVGEGMTETQAVALSAAVEVYQTALSRQV